MASILQPDWTDLHRWVMHTLMDLCLCIGADGHNHTLRTMMFSCACAFFQEFFHTLLVHCKISQKSSFWRQKPHRCTSKNLTIQQPIEMTLFGLSSIPLMCHFPRCCTQSTKLDLELPLMFVPSQVEGRFWLPGFCGSVVTCCNTVVIAAQSV